jgi:hypothetical protein
MRRQKNKKEKECSVVFHRKLFLYSQHDFNYNSKKGSNDFILKQLPPTNKIFILLNLEI